jgi:hypothetical protein
MALLLFPIVSEYKTKRIIPRPYLQVKEENGNAVAWAGASILFYNVRMAQVFPPYAAGFV